MLLTITPPSEPTNFEYSFRRKSFATRSDSPAPAPPTPRHNPLGRSSVSSSNFNAPPQQHYSHTSYAASPVNTTLATPAPAGSFEMAAAAHHHQQQHHHHSHHHRAGSGSSIERSLPPPPSMTLPDPLRPSAQPPPSAPSALHQHGQHQQSHQHQHHHSSGSHHGGQLQSPRTSQHHLPSNAQVSSSYPQSHPPPPPPPHRHSAHTPIVPPQHYSQSAEDSQSVALTARAEEDRRRQEEEKTKQEDLKLRQRAYEYDMLRESIAGGIPPQLIPVIFAGISGGPLAASSLDYVQQWFTYFVNSVPVPGASVGSTRAMARPPSPPAISKEAKAPIASYAPAPMSVAPVQQAPATAPYPPAAYSTSPRITTRTVYAQPSGPAAPPSMPAQSHQHGHQAAPSAPLPPPAPHTVPASSYPAASSVPHPGVALNRQTTADPTAAPPLYAPSGPPPQALQHPAQHADAQQPTESSPSIYFHHWQPPNASGSKESKDSKDTKDSKEMGSRKPSPPKASNVQDDQSSPTRKRKATGGHEPIPAPSKGSPTFSTVSTVSSRSRRMTANRQESMDSSGARAYDPIGRDHPRNKRERSNSSAEDHQQRGTPAP